MIELKLLQLLEVDNSIIGFYYRIIIYASIFYVRIVAFNLSVNND